METICGDGRWNGESRVASRRSRRTLSQKHSLPVYSSSELLKDQGSHSLRSGLNCTFISFFAALVKWRHFLSRGQATIIKDFCWMLDHSLNGKASGTEIINLRNEINS